MREYVSVSFSDFREKAAITILCMPIAGGISDARNGKIFNMFSLINVGERSGSGLCDVFHVWKSSGFDRPEIIESVDPDRITVILRTAGVENIGLNHEKTVPKAGENVPNDDKALSEIEHKVLSIIRRDPFKTAKQIAEECHVSVKSVSRYCGKLKKKGYIRREGATRGKWVLVK